MKNNNALIIFMTILWVAGIFEFFYLVKVKHLNLNYTTLDEYSLNKKSKIYPDTHWKDKVSKYCVNCGHRSFVTKHWNRDRLYCENCKTLHRGKSKLTRHYMYDEALTCMKCGHEGALPKSHDESGINCTKCKMGHYKYYNDNSILK